MGGNNENLKPKTSPKARGKLGGLKSGQAKRERKMLSAMYADFLAKEHNVQIDGKAAKLPGYMLAERVIAKVLARGDGAAVRLLKEIREATEGSKVQMTGADGSPLIPQKITFEIVDPNDPQHPNSESIPGSSDPVKV